MRRTISVRRFSCCFVLLALAVPAWAKPRKAESFDVACPILWQAVADVLHNSGKYEIQTIDEAGQTASYQLGSGRIETVSIAPTTRTRSGNGCQISLDTPSAWNYNSDVFDLDVRVEQAVRQINKNPSAAEASSQTYAPSAPSAPASVAAPGVVSVAPGGTIAVSVDQKCEKDPDPLGLISSNSYSKCKQDELDRIRNVVAAGLTSRRFTVSAAGQPADLQLAVTLTRARADAGLTDFSTPTIRFAAIYQLAASGQPPLSGSVTLDVKANYSQKIEDQFSDKIAADVVAKLGAMPGGQSSQQPGASGAPANTSNIPLADQYASQESFFEIVGAAYRSLAVKPTLPDDARRHKYEAEDAEKRHDAPAAVKAYLAAVASAPWWAEGVRSVALAIAQAGDYQNATFWARCFLALAPDDPKAPLMKQEIEDWSKWVSPLPPASTTAPASFHLAAVFVAVPSVVAQSMNDPDLEGVMITSFYDGSDLQKAGLAKGDVITAVNGRPLHTVQDMLAFTPTLSAGTTLHLTARHGTETKDYEITLTR
jgi:PDZ domain